MYKKCCYLDLKKKVDVAIMLIYMIPLKLQHQCRNTNLSLPLILMGMEEQRALQDCIKAEHAVAVNLASGSMMHSDREQSAVGRMAGSRGDMGNVRAWGTWEMGEHGECRT